MKEFENRLLEKKLTINYDFKAHEKVSFMGNLVALKYQIFGNLISNAIKFSEPGQEITITLDESDNGVCVHVIDNGVGIEPELLEVLFEKNSVPSSSGTSGEKGSGLGISIVKNFVEMSHGAISVQSRTKYAHPTMHGTQFSISFKKSLLS